MRATIVACSALLALALCNPVGATDSAVGKAKVEAVCAECHEPDEWAEEDVESLESKIKDVVSGKTKHKKKLQLTDEEIAGIAVYWAGSTK